MKLRREEIMRSAQAVPSHQQFIDQFCRAVPARMELASAASLA
jgi:tryptophan halogenase